MGLAPDQTRARAERAVELLADAQEGTEGAALRRHLQHQLREVGS